MNQALANGRERLNGTGLPVFARTVREISVVATDRVSSAKDLSDVVSHDAGMTSRLIQITNSSLFNLQSRVDTISSAVVVMGFDAVRELAVSVSVIDEVLKGENHERVSRCMAHGFHAAAHAKTLSQHLLDSKSEEVFVASLLRYVGEMAFWSRAGEEAQQLDAALVQAELEQADLKRVEQQVLGFELAELSSVLADEWSLGELAKQVHQGSHKDEAGVACVLAGHEMAHVLEQYGWESDECAQLLARLARQFDIDEKQLSEEFQNNIKSVSAVAAHFGVTDLDTAMTKKPPAAAASAAPVATASAEVVAEGPVVSAETPARAVLQLDYLHELAEGLERGDTRDDLMTVLVEGVVRSTDAGRCYFLLLSPDRRQLVVKYAYGEDTERLIGMKRSLDNGLFCDHIHSSKVACVNAPVMQPWHGGCQCLLSGIHVAGKAVGLLYLEPVQDQSALPTFRQFSQQVSLILTGAA